MLTSNFLLSALDGNRKCTVFDYNVCFRKSLAIDRTTLDRPAIDSPTIDSIDTDVVFNRKSSGLNSTAIDSTEIKKICTESSAIEITVIEKFGNRKVQILTCRILNSIDVNYSLDFNNHSMLD